MILKFMGGVRCQFYDGIANVSSDIGCLLVDFDGHLCFLDNSKIDDIYKKESEIQNKSVSSKDIDWSVYFCHSIRLDCPAYQHHFINIDLGNIKYLNQENPTVFCYIYAQGNSGKSDSIYDFLTSSDVFLLNDNGDTIERIFKKSDWNQ